MIIVSMSVRQLKDEFNRILEDRQKEKQVTSSRMEEQYKRWRSVSQKYTHEIKSALKKQNIDIDMIRAVRPKFEEDIDQIKTKLELPTENKQMMTNLYLLPLVKLPFYVSSPTQTGYDIQQVKLSRADSGSGWGCGARVFIPPMEIDWWYWYIPEKNGYYSIEGFEPFNGYYIARAFDGFWDCKSVHLKITSSARVYQYDIPFRNWQFPLFNIERDNINEYGRLDLAYPFSFAETVGADPLYICVSQTFDVIANGDDSYGELNFEMGTANFISAPPLIISPPP
jgi:hypothetical protein